MFWLIELILSILSPFFHNFLLYFFSVILAPYGLAGVLTGQSFRVTDHVTRKLMDEWRQYYPVDCSNPVTNQQQRGPGPGGGGSEGPTGVADVDDMVEVVIGNVRAKYPSCYVLVCDADNDVNAAVFNQLAAAEGGQWNISIHVVWKHFFISNSTAIFE